MTTEFESALRDVMDDARYNVAADEEYTPAEADAYNLGATHAIEEALALREADLARQAEHEEEGHHSLDGVFGDVRTTFAIDWENGEATSQDLDTVDETIARTFATLDAMDDCE